MIYSQYWKFRMARCMDLAIWPELAYLQVMSFYYSKIQVLMLTVTTFSRGFGSIVFCPDFQVANHQKSIRTTRNLVAYVKDWKNPVSDGCLQSYRA